MCVCVCVCVYVKCVRYEVCGCGHCRKSVMATEQLVMTLLQLGVTPVGISTQILSIQQAYDMDHVMSDCGSCSRVIPNSVETKCALIPIVITWNNRVCLAVGGV